MRKSIFLLLIITAAVSPAFAQTKKQKIKFSSFNTLGLVNGENSTSAALQTVNGIGIKGLFTGIGLGLDYYLYRSVPVFADFRKEFGSKRNKFFAYADAGINVQWVQVRFKIEPEPWSFGYRNKFHNGVYTDAGFGFSAGMKNNQAFILSLGHSLKTMKETRWYQERSMNDKDIFKYNFSRIVLKFGWRF